ncbi:uncharacterized protein F4812DRAFT_410640 [Daldinia caldariorum]|uniref:uncharacterized protein n=1 Tax=Daldinia caldariorum TaxID=326644 RepID=UPI002008B64F|nr:uncharacterized protein F4812DRAFT_410640 [Daldinia caldariorum]KAI1472862.1 hypothetical protein F4812DRAFT_410640 [Daldinia caldariorum]
MISTGNIPEGAIDGRQAADRPPADHIVPKPIPDSQARDPRKYQLNQMKRRFSPTQNTLQDGTTNLLFRLKPSDPDFPFELDYLECELQVPASYPENPPVLRVKNKDIPRGFAVNIEKGWNRLVQENKGSTLLALTNALDKNLEVFLSERKTETVTLLSFKDTRHLNNSAAALDETASTSSRPVKAPPKPAPTAPRRPYVPEESFTEEQIAAARARRAQEIRQLESRMSRTPHYQKSADGIVYTLPLEPRRRSELPPELQQIQSVQLIIPLLYPLQPLRALFNNVESKDVEALEEIFAAKAAQQKQMNLTSQLNYLSQNIHVLAKQARAAKIQSEVAAPKGNTEVVSAPARQIGAPKDISDDGKSRIHVIPRPPEWSFGHESGDSDNSDDDDSWDSEDDSDEGGAEINTRAEGGSGSITQQVERGTAMSFPSIELHGIELLQVSILNLSVKCERCKTLNDATGLKPEVEKTGSCRKCATAFTAKFRQETVHQNSTRAGFIDVACCTVADMLPSTFVPTCSRCSTPSQGLVTVRGDAVTNVCRECHAKFTFKIPEVKFLAISQGALPPPPSGPRKRAEEKLGLHAGDALPRNGACAHYRRSYRWFRFSCCGKVYACDKCHDEEEEGHAQEWAHRMICGWCSREQNYAPEACGFCGRSVIGKKGKGFWEGGKGTRDRARMSRKDKRKFRRVGGSEGRKRKD